MTFYQTPWWAGLFIVTDVCMGVFFVAVSMRSWWATGTRGRYLATTLAWGSVYLAPVAPLLSMTREVATGDRIGMIGSTALFLLWVLEYRRLHRDDDDHWFRRTGTRLRRWVSARLRTLSPAPATA